MPKCSTLTGSSARPYSLFWCKDGILRPAEGPVPRTGPDLQVSERRGEDLNLRPSGYETYALRPTGHYGLIEFVRFASLPGTMRRHPPRPAKRPVTSKSESVGFSWDSTNLRAIFESFLLRSERMPLNVREGEAEFPRRVCRGLSGPSASTGQQASRSVRTQ
jgi:hypothetical protein